MKKIIISLIPFCMISLPHGALSEPALESNLFWFFDGILFSTCTYYEQGYLPEKIAKRDFDFWHSKIEKVIKNEQTKNRLIARHYENPKCRNLMP